MRSFWSIRAALALSLAAGAVAVHAAGRQPAPDTPLPPVPTPEERRIIRKGEGGERSLEIARAIEAAMLAPGAPVDVEHYTIDIGVTRLPNRWCIRMHAGPGNSAFENTTPSSQYYCREIII